MTSSPEVAPDSRSGMGLLAQRWTRRTTDLLCIAILIGGLLAAAINLWEPVPPSDLEPQLDERATGIAGLSKFPVRQWMVAGNEKSAWQELMAACREELERAPRTAADSFSMQPAADFSVDDWTLIAEDSRGRWQMRQPTEIPWALVGLATPADGPRAFCWGMMRSDADNSWALTLLRWSVPQNAETD